MNIVIRPRYQDTNEFPKALTAQNVKLSAILHVHHLSPKVSCTIAMVVIMYRQENTPFSQIKSNISNVLVITSKAEHYTSISDQLNSMNLTPCATVLRETETKK